MSAQCRKSRWSEAGQKKRISAEDIDVSLTQRRGRHSRLKRSRVFVARNNPAHLAVALTGVDLRQSAKQNAVAFKLESKLQSAELVVSLRLCSEQCRSRFAALRVAAVRVNVTRPLTSNLPSVKRQESFDQWCITAKQSPYVGREGSH